MKTTKREIIEKASLLFCCNGYAGTSLNDISDAVGIKKSGLFFHFKNKKDLYDAVLDRYVVRTPVASTIFAECVDGTFSEFLDAVSARECLVERLVVSCKELCTGIRFSNVFTFVVEGARLNPSCAKALRNIEKDMVDFLEILVKKAQDRGEITDKIEARQIADMFSSSVKGAVYSRMIGVSSDITSTLRSLYSVVAC